jgi:DHA1 family bicyclomycin/chloramphenicol resistance-like MFS transporter
MLIVGRLVQALGACAGGVVARAVVRDRYGHTETARMLSLMALIMGMAPILAPTLGGFLLLLGGWRLNFWFMAAFGIAVGGAALFRMRESRTEATAVHARGEHPLLAYLALFGQRRLMGYALAGGLNGATMFTYISTSPDLLIKTYGIPAWAFGMVFSVNAAGLISGSQINRHLLRHSTPDQILAKSSLIVVGFGVLLAVAAFTGLGGPWTVLPMIFAVLSTYGFMQGNNMAGALNVDPVRAGAISAMMGSVSFACGAMGSYLAGLFHDGTPRPMAVVMLTAVVGSALAIHLLALPQDRARATI